MGEKKNLLGRSTETIKLTWTARGCPVLRPPFRRAGRNVTQFLSAFRNGRVLQPRPPKRHSEWASIGRASRPPGVARRPPRSRDQWQTQTGLVRSRGVKSQGTIPVFRPACCRPKQRRGGGQPNHGTEGRNGVFAFEVFHVRQQYERHHTHRPAAGWSSSTPRTSGGAL